MNNLLAQAQNPKIVCSTNLLVQRWYRLVEDYAKAQLPALPTYRITIPGRALIQIDRPSFTSLLCRTSPETLNPIVTWDLGPVAQVISTFLTRNGMSNQEWTPDRDEWSRPLWKIGVSCIESEVPRMTLDAFIPSPLSSLSWPYGLAHYEVLCPKACQLPNGLGNLRKLPMRAPLFGSRPWFQTL